MGVLLAVQPRAHSDTLQVRGLPARTSVQAGGTVWWERGGQRDCSMDQGWYKAQVDSRSREWATPTGTTRVDLITT
jgi:hypothetical protein